MFRRRVAPCRLCLTNACVSSVGAGAPLGRDGDPALSLLQHRRAQQQSVRPVRQGPTSRLLAKVGVLPDPADVGVERFGELVRALLEARVVIEEDEVELRERLRHRFVVDTTAHDRREAVC